MLPPTVQWGRDRKSNLNPRSYLDSPAPTCRLLVSSAAARRLHGNLLATRWPNLWHLLGHLVPFWLFSPSERLCVRQAVQRPHWGVPPFFLRARSLIYAGFSSRPPKDMPNFIAILCVLVSPVTKSQWPLPLGQELKFILEGFARTHSKTLVA